MEDTSYVNLSLQKYNELYDKAKKYDELISALGDKITESISTILDKFTANEEEKHSGETEQEVEDTEETQEYKFKIGDKVIGNKLANSEYGITIEGWIGTVEEVYKNYFVADGFNLKYECFDKLESEEK